MRRMVALALGLLLGALTSVVVLAVAGRAEQGTPAGPPAATDPSVPSNPRDLGVGETLIVVVAGAYPTRDAAVAASAELSFGDVQGYYAVPIDQFLGLREALRVREDWVLASAFRTGAGAEQFAAFARLVGAPARIVRGVVSLGGAYAGLGQEENPDGSGPLTHPLEGRP